MAETRALIDTNILIDIAVPGRPESTAARELFSRAAAGKATVYVCAGSLKDFYYICRKDLPEQLRRNFISLFMDIFEIAPLDASCCTQAIGSDEPDFEDGLVRAAAERASCEYLITRDDEAYKTAVFKKSDVASFLQVLEGQDL